jgi:hypothetical protein
MALFRRNDLFHSDTPSAPQQNPFIATNLHEKSRVLEVFVNEKLTPRLVDSLLFRLGQHRQKRTDKWVSQRARLYRVRQRHGHAQWPI